MAGLEDALAYADDDCARGTAHQMKAGDVDMMSGYVIFCIGWLVEMKAYADKELAKARQRPKNIELFNNAFAEQGILFDKYRESFERYQASLDNQLYNAMKELQQLQAWRLNIIETVPVADVPAVQAAV